MKLTWKSQLLDTENIGRKVVAKNLMVIITAVMVKKAIKATKDTITMKKERRDITIKKGTKATTKNTVDIKRSIIMTTDIPANTTKERKEKKATNTAKKEVTKRDTAQKAVTMSTNWMSSRKKSTFTMKTMTKDITPNTADSTTKMVTRREATRKEAITKEDTTKITMERKDTTKRDLITMKIKDTNMAEVTMNIMVMVKNMARKVVMTSTRSGVSAVDTIKMGVALLVVIFCVDSYSVFRKIKYC